MGVPGVSRKTSLGIPQYRDKEDTFVLSGAEDLVPVAEGAYEDEEVQVQWKRLLTILTFSTMATFYYLTGFALFNGIRLRDLFKSAAYERTNIKRITRTIAPGFILSLFSSEFYSNFKCIRELPCCSRQPHSDWSHIGSVHCFLFPKQIEFYNRFF